MQRSLWRVVFGLLVAVTISGCSCGGAGADTLPFACSDDAECETPDWLCRRGACVKADAGCAAALEICDDGLENDCDGLVDCADDDCAGATCAGGGRLCVASTCSCPAVPDGGFTESVCGDGLDDDCDTLSDCADPDCEGEVCDDTGLVCAGGACACPPEGQDGGVADEALCADGIDNDCDGVRDCADPGCDTRTCGAGGACTGALCLCPGVTAPEASETSCGDGQDNDCDGQLDCADPDCASDVCGSSGQICAGQSCVCSGNGGTSQPGGETMCNDGADNDCDTQVDCADTSCNTLTCGANGQVCAGAACVCGGNGAPAQASETTCNDGRDNDCDGLTDCGETACNGRSCGSNGRVCSGSLCACSGNGGSAQLNETICSDGFDNDCDGLRDCQDTGCGGRICGANGNVCSGTSCVCGGNGGTVEPNESTCDDQHDNDCDGLTDCEDPSCGGRTCDATGKVCSGAACVCTGNGGTLQADETICDDFVDNDCNGRTDCDEAACAAQVCGGNGQTCVGTSCECPGNDGAEEPQGELSCGDGFDNDCDSQIDCDDVMSCQGRACGANGRTCTFAGTCNCSGNGGTAQATETTCNDGFDNDCDGLRDCADPDCLRETCGTNNVCCFTGTNGCRNLRTNTNCGGCGLSCDSGETCNATGRCSCKNDADCPLNQQCVGTGDSKYCSCAGSSANCATGQVCGSTTCSYP